MINLPRAQNGCSCGEGELVGGVHTLVYGVVQVYHELQELEEEGKGREEVQEIEKGESSRKESKDDHAHGDGMNDSNVLSRSACVHDDVKLKTKEMRLRAKTMRAHVQWKWSMASASCSVSKA